MGELRRRGLSPKAVMLIGGIAIAACIGNELRTAQTTENATIISGSGDFGMVMVGTTSAPQQITVAPKTSLGPGQDDTISSVTLDGCSSAFKIVGGIDTSNGTATGGAMLPTDVFYLCQAGSGSGSGSGCITSTKTYAFLATYTPQTANGGVAESCTVDIVIDGALTTKELTGTAIAAALAATVTPTTTIDFLDQVVYATPSPSTPAVITVANTGSQPMTVSSVTVATASGDGSFLISSGNTASHTVAAGSAEMYGVECEPTGSGGSMVGSVTVNVSGLTLPPVPLKCNGLVTQLIFEPLDVITTREYTPQDGTLDFVNKGTTQVRVDTVGITGGDLSIPTPPAVPFMLGAGSSVALGFHYSAATPTDNPTTVGTVTFATSTSDGSGNFTPNPDRVLGILADAQKTTISVTTGSGAIEPVCNGTTSAADTFLAVANSRGAFVVTGITSSDPQVVITPVVPSALPTPGSAFSMTPPNSVMTFDVHVTPTQAGPIAGTISIATDIPAAPMGSGSPATVTKTYDITSVGLPAGVTALPASIDFGLDPAHMKLEQDVTITNCNQGALNIDSAVISGPDASDFSLTVQPTMVPAGTNGVFSVIMEATHNGTRTATLTIAYDGGETAIALTGQGDGLPGDDDSSGSTGTYYTCSAGGGAASWWPLGLALGMLVLRRRRS